MLFRSPLLGAPDIQVKLVSGHPLWGALQVSSDLWSLSSPENRAGHILYPAAIAMSTFLELHADSLLRADAKGKGRAKNVLELGAGGGLPGLVAALEGAANVRRTRANGEDEILTNGLGCAGRHLGLSGP